jgi:ATP-binding cassette subfamily B protein
VPLAQSRPVAAGLAWTRESDLVAALERKEGISGAREIVSVTLEGDTVEQKLRAGGPAVVDLPGGALLGLLEVRGNQALLLAPDLSVRRIPLSELCDALCADALAPHEAAVDALLDACGVGGARRDKARRALLRERLHGETVGQLRQLRVDVGSSFLAQAVAAGLARPLAALIGGHVIEYLLWLAAWGLAGRGIFSGRLDYGFMLAWALMLMTIVPFRMLATWSQGKLAIGVGGLLKQRLLAGALRLDIDRTRREGAGQLLARVIESETVETLGVSGGLAAVVSLFELGLSFLVLGLGAGRALTVSVLALWLVMGFFLAWRYARLRALWTDARLALTHDMVERMAGHRTRLAQQPPEQWHEDEDATLESYLALSARMDRRFVHLLALVPRGWLLAGIAALLPAFFSGAPATSLGIAVGGILLAHLALKRLTAGVAHLAGVKIAWRQVGPLFEAAAAAPQERPDVVPEAPVQTVLEASDLSYRYREGGRPVLDGVDLRIERGDRVLVEGESGGGKSTLVSLMAGLRDASSGVLSSGAMDRSVLGTEVWRKRVAAAPQYHENHVLSASFLFNVLMARAWPPSKQDYVEAEAVCREVGLGPLLDRMPGGMQQMVGETGWQLSQGERSRLFLARAILQRSDLVILDESFAALDPENLRQSLQCALKRARTLLVIAHP